MSDFRAALRRPCEAIRANRWRKPSWEFTIKSYDGTEQASTERLQTFESDEPGQVPDLGGLVAFFLVLLFLAAVYVLLGYVSVPAQYVKAGTILATMLFVGAPVIALYFAARYEWTPKRALVFLVSGLVLHFGVGSLIGFKLLGAKGFASAVTISLGTHVGLVMWCVGLGALLASMLKEKNLILPVAVFLAGFDIFLVFTPVGPTNEMLQKMPEVLKHIGYTVPKASAAPPMGQVGVFAYVGPADFLFMGMLFVALFRFKMRSRETVVWLVPTLLAYLLLSAKLGPIPLLVPIGICVLVVNAKEFKMTRDEKVSTAVVAALVLAIIGFGAMRRGLPFAPSQKRSGQAAASQAGLPPPAPADQRR